ncbi:MAG: cyclic nucleotide-binding domain-containing protein [Desulforhopalus sp.]|nr:cyclic nucleotide-binding domain-containing protein [Desulforhopalus sp.]
MKNKIGQPVDIAENIAKNIAAAEKERRELRFAYNLNNFERGNVQVLKNDEFIAGLRSYLLADPSENKDIKLKLLKRIGEGAIVEEIPVRERALALLSSTTEFYLDQNEAQNMLVLVHGLCNWLEFETELLPGFSVLIKRLEEVLDWSMDNSCWVEVEEVVILLYRIQSGSLKKSRVIKSLTNKTLQKLEKKDILEKFTDGYLLGNEQQHLFQNILHSIGPKAATYLFNRAIYSDSRSEKFDLLDLISTFGNSAVPALEDCLKSDPPWAVVKNIIYIVSEIKNDAHYALVARYFGHFDERIQHEMIRCVLKLGGQMIKPRLIKGLDFVQDRLKVHILRLLVEQEDNDENVLAAILNLAGKRTTFSVQSGDDLPHALIAALKTFPCRKSVEQLGKMRDEFSRKQGTEQLLLHIDEALMVIEPKMRHSLQGVDGLKDIVSFDNDPVQRQLASEKVRKIEEEVQLLVRAGDVQQAGQLIYDQAITAAKTTDFPVARLLLTRLLEINPMALTEAIELGDFIEEQKNKSITSHHLEIWSELYDEMTTEEFSELYHSLRQENYRKGDIIVQSGENDNNLYFLNSGYISLSCNVGGREIFLKRMQPSNVLGGDQFFSNSVWTVTLRALCEIQVHVLDHAVLKKIAVDHPGIEYKLRKYCRKHTQVSELLKMSGGDRREYARYSVVLQTRNNLMDPYGNKEKRTFNGELFDISRQGMAFTIRISNTNKARLLLGRHIKTVIIVGNEELPPLIGVVVGVRLYAPIVQDFSVHVKLSKKIDETSYNKILSVARRNQ